MAELADSHKVRARNELERLHKGLVVGVDSRVIHQPAKDEKPLAEIGSVDVQSAIKMVREALEALEELRAIAARQREDLDRTEKENAKLYSDLDGARGKIDELNTEISSLRTTKLNLQKSLNERNEERQSMLEYSGKVEDSLKTLVEVIVTSFKDKKGGDGVAATDRMDR